MKQNVLLLFLLFSSVLFAQEDTTLTPDYKNVVRWNLTPTLVLGTGSWVFGYERVLDHRKSFSVNVGFIQMPRFAENVLDSFNIESTAKRNGVSFAADYRFYILGRNKYDAPDGLYWGPYLTNYYFDSQTKIQIVDAGGVQSDIYANTQVNFLMAGVELGYQFTLGKNRRWTVDLVLMGPSLRYDYLNMDVAATGKIDLSDEYLQGIYDALISVFPGLDQLATEGSISTSGFSSSFGAGYRYVLQVGYRF